MASPILSPTFHIGTIKIGSIEAASCFSIGNNFIEDFKSNKKHYQGLGNLHGDNNNFSHSTASLTHHDPSQMEGNHNNTSPNP
ncbi:hypothetical protein J1P26_22175 [Neobacillus sp. MM2021_6]|uniref:hypothetical protein n=1 Tax=Bacillaceae TaxID=186817 RepID=UPI00140C1B7C|nr:MULTISPECIES: hypothetical protein [Bacillaceae]MBO0962413.1 hypothetical protein [Neobacillus sp. MM2021_6]NHC21018.1 hypothetical protein [Bacillus sp. MM2020_4]WML39161.1 hypothetical protein RCG19_18510 [Neobacillus sp. OS1-2]